MNSRIAPGLPEIHLVRCVLVSLCALQRTASQGTVVFSPITQRNCMKPVEAEFSLRLF